jgi:hypothetical protein
MRSFALSSCSGGRAFAPASRAGGRPGARRPVAVRSGAENDAKAAMEAQMAKAMEDPAVQARMKVRAAGARGRLQRGPPPHGSTGGRDSVPPHPALPRAQAMQEAMQRPEVQAQMAQVESTLRNEALQRRMAELKEDPEFKEAFQEIQKGGMAAMMK